MSWLSRLFGKSDEEEGQCMRGHDCIETLKKLELLLDGELTKAEEDNLIVEINKCPGCLKHYKVEQSFKEFVKNRCRKKVDPELVSNIRHLIQQPTEEL